MAARSVPKDVLVNQTILREMGVTDYEPRPTQPDALEFTYTVRTLSKYIIVISKLYLVTTEN